MQQTEATIISNEKISKDFFHLSFSSPNFTKAACGQFLTIALSANMSKILRRPFAISNFKTDGENGIISILYQMRGEGTKWLSTKKSGEKLNVIAPLGNGFPTPSVKSISALKIFDSVSKVFCVAGGVGLGPILFTHNLLKCDEQKKIDSTLLCGFRNSELVPTLDGFNDEAIICSDDGSTGFNGNVVNYLESLNEEHFNEAAVFACGPLPMLKALNNFCSKKNIPLLVSLEEMMGCAVGACMGCIVKTTTEEGYARVCKEGPVFLAQKINWE